MVVGALAGYGCRAYAACVNSGGSTYSCSGAETTTQTINADNATVSTVDGFSVNTSSGDAIHITGDGALSYTDVNSSSLTAADTALYIQSYGDIPAGNQGSVTVKTNGALTGDHGIDALNYGGGPLSITANGDVTGTGFFGIRAQNGSYFTPAGTDLTVTTGAGTAVSGGFFGIRAANYGSGALTITVNGDVTGTNATGVAAINYYGTGLIVTTGAGTTVSGEAIGMSAKNYGSGALTITANGDVTGETDDGIYACHGIAFLTCGAGGGPITITVGHASTITSNGIGADDFAIDIAGDPGHVTVAGTLNGGVGGAIQFEQGAALNDRLELQPGAILNGNVFAGPGTDSLVLGGIGDASFDVSAIGAGQQYQDFEIFEKKDSSHWTLTGTNTVIDNFAVNGGLLSVNGSMPNAAFTVNSGTLGGTGSIGSLTVNGGTLAPGNSIGTMTVNGAFTLGGGAIYEVEVNAAGENDKVIVNGTVNLTGATLRVLAANGDYKTNTKYTIIENDGIDAVVGTFASITSSLAFLVPTVFYNGGTGNDVVLTLERNSTLFSDVAQTRNQRAVAGALDQFPTNNPLFLTMLNQTASGARQAFDALSGEIHATVAGMLADDSRYVRDAILGRLMQAGAASDGNTQMASLAVAGPQVASLDSSAMTLGYPLAGGDKSLSAPARAHLAFWTHAFGAWANFGSDGNAATANRNLGGFVSGMDAQVGGSWRAGLATGASFSNVDVNARYSSGQVKSYHLGGYLGGMAGTFALRGGGMWAWSDIDTSRAVVFPGFYERQKASYNADTGQLFGEAAYPIQMWGMALEPFAGLAYVSVNTDSFHEHGGALASLNGRNTDENVGYTILGLRAAQTMTWGAMLVTPHLSAAWQHALDDVTPDAALAFATTGIGFTVYGVPLAQDSALLDTGLDLALGPRTSAGVSYSGQFGNRVTDNAVKGRFTWLF
jgi:outer membrane autotransporter protein